MGVQPGELVLGPGVVEGPLQHVEDMALLAGGPQALGEDELEDKAGVGDQGVSGRGALAAQEGPVLVKGLHDGVGDLTCPDLVFGHVQDLGRGRERVGLEDVHLVGVAQDIAEEAGPGVEALGQAKVAVPGDGGTDGPVLVGLGGKGPDAAQVGSPGRVLGPARPLEENLDAQGGVGDRLGVAEGPVAAHLLKAADVVKEAAQPSQVPVLRGQGLAGGAVDEGAAGTADAACDAVAEVGHPQGMLGLEADLGVAHVVGCHVGLECRKGFLTVDVHGSTRPFSASGWAVRRKGAPRE